MGQNYSDMNIDLNCEFLAPKSISDFLAELSAIDDVSLRLTKLNLLLQAFEEGAKKVDAVRRELPISMRLLYDAIELVRGEVWKLKGKEKEKAPVMEFLPLKCNSDGDARAKTSNDESEKNSLMNSAVLCDYSNFRKPSNQLFPKKSGDVVDDEEKKVCVPYKRKAVAVKVEAAEEEEKKDAFQVDGLSLSPPAVTVDKSSKMNKHEQRKQRRCWSPELHQQFVNALDKLGGAQVATPKQIREIMNVEGLTNDEVKSHLQKYRLHFRRLTASPSSSTSTWPAQPYRVGCGGALTKAKTGAQSAGSPESPLHLGLPVSVTLTGANAVGESKEEESQGFDGRLTAGK